MSRIALTPNASGTGTLTIAAPNTNTDRTLTLPDATGTVLAAPAGAVTISSSAPSNSLTVDGSGNVGIGVTPSAWTRKALQIGDAAAAYVANGSGGATVIATNMFFDGANKYATTAAAARYSVGSGNHEWYIAPSGTAGNSISFTQAMTLDANGDLAIGSTDTDSRFKVEQAGVAGLRVAFNNGSSNFYDADLNIFRSGNGTERARIDASGNLLVGTTSVSNGALLTVSGTVSASLNGRIYSLGTYNNTTASGANMHIAADGHFFRSTSSLKYKTDVQDATHGLADVMALRPVTYRGKNDGDLVFGGLIAEEVHEAGLTEFVQYAEDGSPDALAYGNMVSLCIKAIQEQQALVTALTARVAELEAK